jgi:hypothetical protein
MAAQHQAHESYPHGGDPRFSGKSRSGYFAAEQNLSATVATNGTEQTVSLLRSRSSTLVNAQVIKVPLISGNNVVSFSDNTAAAPAIDKIEILLDQQKE